MKFNSMYTLLIILTLLTILPHIYCESFELKSNTINTNLKPLIEGTLIHRLVIISPGDYTYVDVSVMKDAYVIVDVYELYGQEIDFGIIRPDGSWELPERRITFYRHSFTATMSGTYKIKLGNTFSLFYSKYVQIAVSTDDPPHTVTSTTTSIVTNTLTTTRTLIHTTTNTVTNTYVTSVTYTTRETITATTTTTATPTTVTERVTQIDWPVTSLISIITLAIGFAVAYVFIKMKK